MALFWAWAVCSAAGLCHRSPWPSPHWPPWYLASQQPYLCPSHLRSCLRFVSASTSHSAMAPPMQPLSTEKDFLWVSSQNCKSQICTVSLCWVILLKVRPSVSQPNLLARGVWSPKVSQDTNVSILAFSPCLFSLLLPFTIRKLNTSSNGNFVCMFSMSLHGEWSLWNLEHPST